MDRLSFINICNNKLKLIRVEKNFSQEKMSKILGVSKKTLVEIEKGRSSLGWSSTVCLCYIFSKSDILQSAFGGEPKEIILELAFEGKEPDYPQTMGGKVWWVDIETSEKFKIQQNIISRHYRILDALDRRLCSSFDLEQIKNKFMEIENE